MHEVQHGISYVSFKRLVFRRITVCYDVQPEQTAIELLANILGICIKNDTCDDH